ncbi:TIGR03084 family metal-binding protein [Nocardioides sp.]|uniref:TIGR03084 family metal-binding protein n=1 Tax=Nocardioides sp. TaxID=35761 RepID=UPI0039E6486A
MLEELLADLATESDALRAAVAPLDDAGWRSPTPAQGWDIATQIGHLAWTDEASLAAAAWAKGDPAGWDALVAAALADPAHFVDASAAAVAAAPPAELLARWDAGRTALAAALREADGRLPWFGPPMSPASMATARFMETWAHGLDVYDALGIEPERSDRVRHVCHLGIRTRGFAFAAHGLEAPAEEFRVSLILPSGALFEAGPAEAAQSVTGSAWDFARLVTQRVHRDDTDLVAVGADAERWLTIAQAFAGQPGGGRSRA